MRRSCDGSRPAGGGSADTAAAPSTTAPAHRRRHPRRRCLDGLEVLFAWGSAATVHNCADSVPAATMLIATEAGLCNHTSN